MSTARKGLRLDEILLKSNLATQEQIQEALVRQKAHGGKLGSQLLYMRHIDEAGLVTALAIQFRCEGVVISKLKISKKTLDMIPSKVAISRKAIPFGFDAKQNLLKIACEDPTDEDLINELNFVIKGKNIKLYLAAELALNTVIARHYRGQDVSLSDSLSFEIPDTATDTGQVADATSAAEAESDAVTTKQVLLVTDEVFSGPLLKSLLERDSYKVTVTDSADDAIDLIGEQSFHTVFIKDTVMGDYIDLIDRLRKISPRTVVRYYESASALLLNEDSLARESDLFFANLDLFTSIIASQNKLFVNHSGRVGKYVSKLCSKLGLPQREKLTITTAAYIHDLAKFYYHEPKDTDVRKQVTRTAKLLQSVNYSPVIIAMLRSMYKDLKGKYTKRLPIEVLGGNIITIVDLFCASILPEQKLSLDKFEVVKKKMRDFAGRLFLSEIVEAFIAMVQDEILTTAATATLGQIMILADKPENMHPVELRLRNEGFRVISETSMDTFSELCKRSEPDVILLISAAEPAEITTVLKQVSNLHSEGAAISTFLLVNGEYTAHLTAALDEGVEDIVALDANLDILVVKLKRIITELNEKARKQKELKNDKTGASGRLTNMSIIDILQAMGPGQKTARITVTSEDKNQKLEMYLDKGRITFASLGSIKGADAVYEALSWADGIWTIEPISSDDLPQPNNNLTNEAILMEGCRLLDERARTGQLL